MMAVHTRNSQPAAIAILPSTELAASLIAKSLSIASSLF